MAKKAILLIVAVTVFSSIHLSFAQQAPIKQITPQSKPLDPMAVFKNQVGISSSDFDGLVSQLFSGAYLRVGGVSSLIPSPMTVMHVNVNYHKTEVLGTLASELPPEVKQQTIREAISYYEPPIIRDSEIRAWTNNQGTDPWKGFIENGRFKIRIQFESNLFIGTSKLVEKKTGSGWEKYSVYNDSYADVNCPDYFYVALCLDVYLIPVIQNGMLSYGTVATNWFWYEDKGFVWPVGALVSNPFAIPHGHPLEKDWILQYKTYVMDTIQKRVVDTFMDNVVRGLITNALTSKVKSGTFSNRTIVTVSGQGTNIFVQFN